jgi:hypothetical protein
MSTTTVSYSSTANEVSLRELRRKEEKSRVAARRKEEKEHEDLRRKEERAREIQRRQEAEALAELRRRLSAAQQSITTQEARYTKLVELLDEKRSRLPDLMFFLPPLLSAPTGQNPAFFESHATELTQMLNTLEPQANTAINAAEVTLERRKKLAATWMEIHSTVAEIAARNKACTTLADQLNKGFIVSNAASSLHKTATLEEAQAHLKSLHQILKNLQDQHKSFKTLAKNREIAHSLRGNEVQAASSEQRLTEYEMRNAHEKMESVKLTINNAVTKASFSGMAELPMALQLQATFAIEQAAVTNACPQVAVLINRHRVRLDNIAKAEKLLSNPPKYADDTTGKMEIRWRYLINRLQAVTCGLDEWSGSLELEYHQIQKDCACAMQRAYAKANFIAAAIDSDFQISTDGDDLILMDLTDYPGYFVEVEKELTDDGYLTVAKLKKEFSVNGDHDAVVTGVVCKKMQEMAQSNDTKVDSGIEVLERKPEVTRAKRPTSTRQQARAMSIKPNY